MSEEEIIRRLKWIASHAVHVIGEEPYALSLDDGIAASEAALLLENRRKQKHGHWKLVQDYYDDEHWQCSACDCEWYLEAGNPEENNMLYCPECGAKMDGEGE